ncbi:uncharacterized protein LOC115923345 [Strongylocentrotus purpuratus]|uniref:Uncharacterized protein n=1 Tax=Strongylocentrotus purpuratus TaxID=7668 RepID=A0A7M7NPU3_STRPU|nr:uncharacterized protein LOC115923345 [Strongylocentrotus purpuratus]
MTVNRDPYDRVISSYFYCLKSRDTLYNLNKWFAVIGLVEEFDISLQLFEATFGLPFKKFFTGKKQMPLWMYY